MKIFLYDESVEGFYTAVFDAYPIPDVRIARREIQIGLTDELCEISTDETKAQRVRKKLKSISRNEERNIRTVLCHCDEFAPQLAYLYLRRLVKRGAKAKDMLTDVTVADFFDRLKQVDLETERMRGFLRFKECKGGVLYAPFSPDHDILTRLFPHFANRLNGERFIIHDVKRKKAVLYKDGASILLPLSDAEIELDEKESDFERLWIKYYHAVDIRQRKNTRQMNNCLPVRYRKFLPETNTIYSSSSKDDLPPLGGG